MHTTTIRIELPSDDERDVMNLLTPRERLALLVAGGRDKASRLSLMHLKAEYHAASTEGGETT